MRKSFALHIDEKDLAALNSNKRARKVRHDLRGVIVNKEASRGRSPMTHPSVTLKGSNLL